MIGETLGHYRILAEAGSGGMGVVYRARDSRLNRVVAIKMLPEAFSQDPQRLARFHREARMLASLNHPGIAAIFGLEKEEDVPFLVLEYIDGTTLAERLARGRIPLREALVLLGRVAEALAAAHKKGIVHRDLKPANLMIQSDGTIKILDFGLARYMPHAEPEPPSSESPTSQMTLTRRGEVVGTVNYMSPEQTCAKPVDHRTDIWAFGCVLYEVIAGKRTFAADTPTGTVAAILRDTPDWKALPAHVPPTIRALLRRCLGKDPDRRLHDMTDARIEIDEALEEADEPGDGFTLEAAPSRGWWARASAALALGILLGALAVGAYRFFHRPHLAPLHFAIPLPKGTELALDDGWRSTVLAISPDGRRVVFGGQRDGEEVKLFLYDMNQQEAVAIEGTDRAASPFFSPCGQWIAFFADEGLQKVSLEDGTILSLCEAPDARGGSWGEDDTILFASRKGEYALYQVAAAGGIPQPFHTTEKHAEKYYRPHRLPGTEVSLAIVGTGLSFDKYNVAVVPPDSSSLHLLATGSPHSTPVYVRTGHILYSFESSLRALRFDLDKLEPRGDPFAVLEGVTREGTTDFAVSDEGTLVYVLETEPEGESTGLRGTVPVWVDREGTIDSLAVPPGDYVFPNISPDGKHVAFTIFGGKGRRNWILELGRGILAPLTFGENDHLPIWSPDGSTITFSSNRGGGSNLYMKPSDGSGEAERLTWSEYHQCPSSWSPDGRTLVYAEFTPETSGDLWLIDPYDAREPRPFLKTPTYESHGMISPDGHWIAYTSFPAKQAEVFVRPYPGPGVATQVSTAGGNQPLWSSDGNELFFRAWEIDPETDSQITIMMAVGIDTHDGLQVGQPQALFRGRYKWHSAARPCYDVSRDGERFLMITAAEPPRVSHELRVVLNWFERLRELE